MLLSIALAYSRRRYSVRIKRDLSMECLESWPDRHVVAVGKTSLVGPT